MKILVFDNYDSFTYNLVHLVEKITGYSVDVHRNDQIALDAVDAYDKIILSPGPGLPEEAGLLLPLIKRYAPTKSILGVCLGHQAIAEVFGGRLINLSSVYHGVSLPVNFRTDREPSTVNLFKGLSNPFMAGRYHSWVVDPAGFPETLEVTATDSEGHIMALRHKQYDVLGVQFHPESVLTPEGARLMENWIGGTI
ncbi:MAG TPA: aminodeoxychorismate/anthranilate synthase component II [Puia sp.]|nr:aminodeoxychorismate/anthranilate synthase component II [Puia sp.]